MAGVLTPAPSLAAVRQYLSDARRPANRRQQLGQAYTIAICVAILGSVAYGAASTALAEVVGSGRLAQWGPSVMLLVLLAIARLGIVQGPVVFSVADVAHLLGAPLRRRELVAQPLARACALGAAAGAVIAGVLLLGLTGEHRHLPVANAVGLLLGVALSGVLGVLAAWGVSIDRRRERQLRRASWAAVVLAAGLAVGTGVGSHVWRTIALWSGPWGWAIQAGAGDSTGMWLPALGALALLVVAVAVLAWRFRGAGETERFRRRAEGRTQLRASLIDMNVRTARRDLAEVAGKPSRARRERGVRWLRRRAVRGPGQLAERAVIWRDMLAAVQTPQVTLQGVALTVAGSALALGDAGRVAGAALGAALIYVGAARLLEPLRAELDVPTRTRHQLGLRAQRALLAHAVFPLIVVVLAAVAAAIGLALAGALPAAAAATVVLLLVAPAAACCACNSARRQGRLPREILIMAGSADPSGGSVIVLGWLILWPAVATVVVALTMHLAVAHRSAGTAVVLAAVALFGTVAFLRREIAD
jgi:hypothetical protein